MSWQEDDVQTGSVLTGSWERTDEELTVRVEAPAPDGRDGAE